MSIHVCLWRWKEKSDGRYRIGIQLKKQDLAKPFLSVALEGKSYVSLEAVMKSIEDTKNESYCVIGELHIRLKDKQTGGFIDEYIPFTAYLSENNDEFTCDSLELEISEDSLFSN